MSDQGSADIPSPVFSLGWTTQARCALCGRTKLRGKCLVAKDGRHYINHNTRTRGQ